MTVKTRPATPDERRQYAMTPQGPDKLPALYPLTHFAVVDGRECVVECPNEVDGPKYEVIAPDGMVFDDAGDPLHSMLAINMADLRDRLDGARLIPCPDDCCSTR